ncbi:protein SOB FIVE-LIKE 5-like isoform X2 [Tasmannia lanceolata]|uniref:protein SOB FIVE-LIKE 5-like isoform X2 n=1 Tax=Tasmannia lanceolata TaxID=3420 RepID=UPI004063A359
MLGMDKDPLECTSGCESGWTMYLDQTFGKPSSLSTKKAAFPIKNDRFIEGGGGFDEEEKGKEEEEDLSMVSDASSGPPHFHEDDEYYNENVCFCSTCSTALAKRSYKRRRLQIKEPHHPSFLDDTASSHVFSFPKSSFTPTNKQVCMENVLDFSIGFSATHLKGKSALQKHFNFLQKSLPGKPASAKPVCREESRNKTW